MSTWYYLIAVRRVTILTPRRSQVSQLFRTQPLRFSKARPTTHHYLSKHPHLSVVWLLKNGWSVTTASKPRDQRRSGTIPKLIQLVNTFVGFFSVAHHNPGRNWRQLAALRTRDARQSRRHQHLHVVAVLQTCFGSNARECRIEQNLAEYCKMRTEHRRSIGRIPVPDTAIFATPKPERLHLSCTLKISPYC